MIRLQGTLPRDIAVAVSGGVDSMVALDFLRRNHRVIAVFFNHGTPTSDDASWFLRNYFKDNSIAFVMGGITRHRHRNESQEEYWRNERYAFFKEIDLPVVTAHHLDDCVETWIMTSLHGEGRVIPYSHANVIRPFRLTGKQEFCDWAERYQVTFQEDLSNYDTAFARNYVRHELMPHVLKINPGIAKTVSKKIKLEFA